MANEMGTLHNAKFGCWPYSVDCELPANRGTTASTLEYFAFEGESPGVKQFSFVYSCNLQSRSPWNWSVKWVVSFI